MARVSGTALLASLQPAAPPIAYKDASNVAMDIGLLAVFDGAPLAPFAAGGFEDTLRAAAQDNAQLLIKTLFELPVERDPEAGKLAILPARNLTLPREKPPPEPKAPTRWEKFAAEKGIAKKGKRSRLAFDPATGEDAPRFGYKRSRDPASDWLYELKGGDAPDVDHLERRALEKQRRVVNNQMSQASNLERAAREKEGRKGAAGGASLFGFSVDGGGGSAPAGKKRPRGGEGGESARLPVGIPSIPIAEGRADALAGPGKHPKPRPSDGMGVKKAQVAFAQVSTASMGKFDRKSNMEPVLRKDPVKLRRLPNEARAAERKRDALVLANVLKGVAGGAPAAAVTHLPVPSANAAKPGKPGIKTAAPRNQPRARAQARAVDERRSKKGFKPRK